MALDWFGRWAKRHIDRHRRADWPAPTSDFWITLHERIESEGVQEDVAEDASKALAFGFPKFLDGHHAALFAAIRRVYACSEVPDDDNPIRRWRADAADQVRRDADLDALWESLPEPERAAIEARVCSRRPHVRRLPFLFHSLCIDEAVASHQISYARTF